MNLVFPNERRPESERTVLHQPLPLPRDGVARRVQLLPAAPESGLPAEGFEKRWAKLWELGETLHCSIIGTCLSTAELRQVLGRTDVPGIEKATDHELHILGVLAAGRRDAGGRLVHKALDRRHRSTLAQFAKATTAAALRTLWDEAVKKGDIPGAYWAVLTHPASTVELVKHVFGEIHMLSHLVGAANRADIRRLCQLEEENAALHDKLARQQRHLRDAQTVRDEAVRRLSEKASAEIEHEIPVPTTDEDRDRNTRALIDDLNRRLSIQSARAEKLQERIDAMSASLKQAQSAQRGAEHECERLRLELSLTDERIDGMLLGADQQAEKPADLSGAVLLYVGGRAHQIPTLRALIERLGGQLLHHDGGIDDNPALLPGLIGRAALVLFPVDCVSHGAVTSIKRLCSHSGKRYLPLRTSSATCLLAALSEDAAQRACVPVDA